MSKEADTIIVLEGREAVRRRPAMYVGSNGTIGLNVILDELLQNCLNEANAGYGSEVLITFRADGSVSVEDKGRGIPLWIVKEEQLPLAELVLTKLHAWKYCSDSPRNRQGRFRTGCAVVNALSEWLYLEVRQNGCLYEQHYKQGIPVAPLCQTGITNQTGTKITYKPDPEIFVTTKYNFGYLTKWLGERAFLNKGVRIVLSDQREVCEHNETFCYENGLADYVQLLNAERTVLHQTPLHFETASAIEGLSIEFALQYNDSTEEQMLSYANQLHTYDGGKHHIGFRSGLTRAINHFAKIVGLTDKRLDGNSVRKGLVAVVSVVLPAPEFAGPKRGILHSDVKEPVAAFVFQKLTEFFAQHPSVGKTIVNKVIQHSQI